VSQVQTAEERETMTIHDILRFPRRISEVLGDLHHAVAITRDYAAVVAEKQYRDCQVITRGYSDRIGELTARITELESSLETSHEAERSLESKCTELESQLKTSEHSDETDQGDHLTGAENMVTFLSARVKELESQLKARDSQPLPWRPIGEYVEIDGALPIFKGPRTPKSQVTGLPLKTGPLFYLHQHEEATHFLYLDVPTPAKAEPKVVAWAVVDGDGKHIISEHAIPMVWNISDPDCCNNAKGRCSTYDGNNRKYRAVRLAIVEK
jgi:hypothetical protein